VIKIEQFTRIQEYKQIGLSQTKSAAALGITTMCIRRYWNMSPEEFTCNSRQDPHHLDSYRQFILEHLKLCPQIRDTNVYLKLLEAFPHLKTTRSTFYRYMKSLRTEHGYLQTKTRLISPRNSLPPGFEAQVDFGQYKLPDMYGRNTRVYFFCMVLSFSRMKFVYFSPDPFTTSTAIRAHDYAFRYFGGRPQTILYDQDRVFVISENLGNILFVRAFEDYVRKTGYSVALCRPRDPQSKGKIENVVGYIKSSFLDGRVYCGIDNLNSDALAWLDREGNGKTHEVTRKVPRELFVEEIPHLIHVSPLLQTSSKILSLDDKGSVKYNGNLYHLRSGPIKTQQRIRLEDDGVMIMFYEPETGELLAKFPSTDQVAQVFKQDGSNTKPKATPELVKHHFANHERVLDFLQRMDQELPKYYVAHCIRIYRMTKFYSNDQLLDGMSYCLNQNCCNASELLAYLMASHGQLIAKKFLSPFDYRDHLTRSKEIWRSING